MTDNSRDRKRIAGLESELDQMRREAFVAEERKAFDGFAAELQGRLPEHCPPDHARNALLAAAAENPNIEAAWRFRTMSNEDRRAAELEFQRLERLHAQVLGAPDSERKATVLREIEERGWQVGLALNSAAILLKATREIEKKAKEFAPIDIEATFDRNMVAQAIRDGGVGKGMPPEPPPNFGTMTDQELRRYCKQFGF